MTPLDAHVAHYVLTATLAAAKASDTSRAVFLVHGWCCIADIRLGSWHVNGWRA